MADTKSMYRIFIVEDDEIIARTVKSHLETMSDELRKSTIFFENLMMDRLRKFYKLLLTGVERIKIGHTNKKYGGMS